MRDLPMPTFPIADLVPRYRGRFLRRTVGLLIALRRTCR